MKVKCSENPLKLVSAGRGFVISLFMAIFITPYQVMKREQAIIIFVSLSFSLVLFSLLPVSYHKSRLDIIEDTIYKGIFSL